MSPSSHSLLQYQKLRGHMTAQSKDGIVHMVLELSLGHRDECLRGRVLSSVPFPPNWLEFKLDGWNVSNPWSRRAKPGVEAARTRKEAPGSFVALLPSNRPWLPVFMREQSTATFPGLCYSGSLAPTAVLRPDTYTWPQVMTRSRWQSQKRQLCHFLMSAWYLQSAASWQRLLSSHLPTVSKLIRKGNVIDSSNLLYHVCVHCDKQESGGAPLSNINSSLWRICVARVWWNTDHGRTPASMLHTKASLFLVDT